MGGQQASQVLQTVSSKENGENGPGTNSLLEQYEQESSVYFGTSRLWDDGIIDPRDTRHIVGLCLDIARDAEHRVLRPNTFGVARL